MKPTFRTMRQRYHTLLDSKTVLLDGIRVDARVETVGSDVRREIIRGNYEFAERKLLQKVLRSGDRVVEIGAGIGVIGLLASRLVGAKAVTSFEANPSLETVIRANYDLNNLHPNLEMKAVTLDGGPVRFFVTSNLLSSSLHERGNHEEVEVDSIAIQDVIARYDPTVLVLDVEGAEADFLPPANLENVRAMLIETHANVVGKEAIQAMETSLVDKGFNLRERQHRNILVER